MRMLASIAIVLTCDWFLSSLVPLNPPNMWRAMPGLDPVQTAHFWIYLQGGIFGITAAGLFQSRTEKQQPKSSVQARPPITAL